MFASLLVTVFLILIVFIYYYTYFKVIKEFEKSDIILSEKHKTLVSNITCIILTSVTFLFFFLFNFQKLI